MAENEDKVAKPDVSGAAATGVTGAPGAAATGVARQAEGTPPAPPPPKPVPTEEDFRRLQAVLNRQVDAQRREAELRGRAIQDREAALQQQAQEIERLQQEMHKLKTSGLPEEEAQLEQIKYERDALAKRYQAERAQWQQQNYQWQQQMAQVAQYAMAQEEQQARNETIKLFLEGGTTPGGRRVEAYAQYGLTAQDLAQYWDPTQMEALATEKRNAHLAKREEELNRRAAGLKQEVRQETGATKFDQGEPTSGGAVPFRAGDPKFRELVEKVKAGQHTFRRP